MSVGNYIGAINIFSSVYATDPESYYGELSYLYLGKAYALYFYSLGERSGIRSTIAFLNKYFYEYKTPKFVHIQREFLGDCYYMLGWYKNAKALYDSLYQRRGEPRYLIKYALSSAITGSMEGYTQLLKLKEENVKDIQDLYYTAIGYFMFNLEEYKDAVNYLSLARSLNPYLENDPAFLYRLGASYYKVNDIKKAIFYLELASKKDFYKEYEDKIDMYLIFIYLDNKNYKDAFEKIKKYADPNILFSNRIAQKLYSSLWMYYDFIKTYKDFFVNYREKLRDIAWLNIEESASVPPLLGIYYLSLKEQIIEKEDISLMAIKNISTEDLKKLSKEKMFLGKIYESLEPEKDTNIIISLYKANRKNFRTIFDKETHKHILAKALLNAEDPDIVYVARLLKNKHIKNYIEGIYAFIQGEKEKSKSLLRNAVEGIKDKERYTALFLIAYQSNSIEDYEKFLKEAENIKERDFLKEYAMLKLADRYFEKGNYKKAKIYYRRFIDYKNNERDHYFWWAVFQMGRIGEIMKDRKTIKWVVKKAEETNNIWSKAIMAIWG